MAKGNPHPVHKFTSENQPKNRHTGPRNTAQKFLASMKVDMPEMKVSKNDYYEILQVMLGANKEYITELAKREDIPVSLLCVIKAIKSDIDMGTTKTVDSLLDRLFGKSSQPVEMSGELQSFKIERVYHKKQVKKEDE